jgi:tRNA(Ile)-lysidine synthase
LGGNAAPPRDRLERAAARLLAEAGRAHDAGYLSIALPPFLDAPKDVQKIALRQMLLAVSGADYAPDLEPPSSHSDAQSAQTLGGCLIQALRGRLCVFREAAAAEGRRPVAPGWTGRWDGRFRLEVARDIPASQGWEIGALGQEGLRQAVDRFKIRFKRHSVPLPARLALPALWRGEHLFCQPHLHLGEGLAAQAAPRHTVTTCGFTVAGGEPHTIYSLALC